VAAQDEAAQFLIVEIVMQDFAAFQDPIKISPGYSLVWTLPAV